MTTLAIPNVPDDLLARLQDAARAECRSINDEALLLLERALRTETAVVAQTEILNRIRRRRIARGRHSGPAVIEMPREDRAR